MLKLAMSNRLLSAAEISEYLGLSEETVRRYIRHGELKSMKFGRRVLVHPDDLDAFVASHRSPAHE